MLRFVCDSCNRTKESDDTWILGFAAEAVGVTSAQREVTIMPEWERERAVHPLAVHFCSLECKEDYIEKLFVEEPLTAVAATTRPVHEGHSTRSKKARTTKSRRKRAA